MERLRYSHAAVQKTFLSGGVGVVVVMTSQTTDTFGGGKNFQMLANAVSDAIHTALKRGMEMDEAVSCVVAVAADYARVELGKEYLSQLATVIIRRHEMPVPEASYD